MLNRKREKVRKALGLSVGIVFLVLAVCACANIGTPDGGAYDELPPKFVKSTPVRGALNNTRRKITIEFDEYIKLEKASEKVVISPPQIEAPEIKPSGKHVTVNLQDSLKPNTTYTIDFSDAIVDNNEGNPLGDFAFTFSTGLVIDTMQVSGTILNAADLEPVKGMLVGLHANLADSAFTRLPFDRVSRTDSRGRFSIRGISPGTYRIYGLADANQNYAFDQKSEQIAFEDSLVIPRMEERIRQDTLWRDSLAIDTVMDVRYTHYLPDNLILRAFKEDLTARYLVKSERPEPQKFSFYFSAPSDTLPLVAGLNFDAKDAFLVEKGLANDTIHYWIKDSLIYKKDTLDMAVTYLYTDTLDRLVPRTDTLHLSARKIYVKEKKQKKKDEPFPTEFLKVKVSAPSSMNIYDNIRLEFDEPLAWFDTAAIHLEQQVDTLWKSMPFIFRQDSLQLRRYELLAEWKPENNYRFAVDSTAFHGLYGLFTDQIEQNLKVRSLDEYSALYLRIQGIDGPAVAELLTAQDKVVSRVAVENGEADFYFLDPGKYYVRLFADSNRNGKWDTGLYEERRQPEEMYYYPYPLELKAMWEVEQDWAVKALPLDKQKPDELKQQKPDDDKKKKERNRERNRTR